MVVAAMPATSTEANFFFMMLNPFWGPVPGGWAVGGVARSTESCRSRMTTRPISRRLTYTMCQTHRVRGYAGWGSVPATLVRNNSRRAPG